MGIPTMIAPVISPNFLSGTTDTTYQLHLTGEGNQALIEITDPASYANLNFKTPTQVWAMTAAGATAPSLPGTFHLFDLTAGVPLWWVEPGTGNTTIKGIVSAQGHEATGNIDIAEMPIGTIALDVAYPIGRLSSKSVNPELGGIQLIGVDNTGRLFTYMECAEPTVGNQVVAIYPPLQVSGVVTAPFFFATQLSDNTPTDNNAVVDYGANTARLIGRGGGTGLADVQLTGTTNQATNRSQVYCEGVEPSGAGSAVFIVHVPLELPAGIAGNVSMTGDLTVENFTAENLAINGDAIVNGNLQAERADFTGCFVNGSEVLTAADLPPGGVPYPPPGLGISTGSAWEEESIDATNPVFSGMVSAGTKVRAYGFTPFDITKTYASIGTGNPSTNGGVARPDLMLINASAPLDQKMWLLAGDVDKLWWSATQDSGSDHAWFIAHRSNYSITALDLIVSSAATEIIGAANGLTLGWNLTAADGETDFVNNRALGAGGFNWYNVGKGDVLTSSSPALMKLDSSGKLTCNGDLVVGGATAAIGNAIDIGDRALGTFGGRPDVQSNGGELFINTVNGHGLYLNYDSGTGVNFGNGSGAVVGSVDSSGNGVFNGSLICDALASPFTDWNDTNQKGGFFFVTTTYPNAPPSSDARGFFLLTFRDPGLFGAPGIIFQLAFNFNNQGEYWGRQFSFSTWQHWFQITTVGH